MTSANTIVRMFRAGKAELGYGIALDQVSDRGGMHEDAGDVAAGLLHGARRGGQGAARRGRAVISAGQAHRGELTVLEIQDCAEQDNLALEGAAEEIAIALLDAGAQVGEGEGRDVASQPSKVERHCIRYRARDRIAGQLGRAGRRNFRLSAKRTRSELHRHRGDRPALDGKAQRHSSDHVVVVGVDIERADGVAHRHLLRTIGHFRMVVAQDFAEHQLAAVGELPERDEVVPVKSSYATAERRIAERNLRLLD